MPISILFSLPLLCMSLLASAALAEIIAVPDKEQRQGMSFDEYSKYRENMRLHMEKMKSEDARRNAEASGGLSDQKEKSQRDSAYGQGYRSRTQHEDRPEAGGGNRHEHPRAERFNRGDMGRR